MDFAFPSKRGVRFHRHWSIFIKNCMMIWMYDSTHGCLTKWAEQGVLMLNTVLTVRAHQANSHRGIGWEEFTDAAILALNNRTDRLSLFCGELLRRGRRECLRIQSILSWKHRIQARWLLTEVSLEAEPFSQTNAFLEKNGIEPIDWQIE